MDHVRLLNADETLCYAADQRGKDARSYGDVLRTWRIGAIACRLKMLTRVIIEDDGKIRLVIMTP